eukprot:sb/3469663/
MPKTIQRLPTDSQQLLCRFDGTPRTTNNACRLIITIIYDGGVIVLMRRKGIVWDYFTAKVLNVGHDGRIKVQFRDGKVKTFRITMSNIRSVPERKLRYLDRLCPSDDSKDEPLITEEHPKPITEEQKSPNPPTWAGFQPGTNRGSGRESSNWRVKQRIRDEIVRGLDIVDGRLVSTIGDTVKLMTFVATQIEITVRLAIYYWIGCSRAGFPDRINRGSGTESSN